MTHKTGRSHSLLRAYESEFGFQVPTKNKMPLCCKAVTPTLKVRDRIAGVSAAIKLQAVDPVSRKYDGVVSL